MKRMAMALLAFATHDVLAAGISWDQTEIREEIIFGTPEIQREIFFVNRSNAPLNIATITSSCSCTVAKTDKTTYAASERGRLLVTFKPELRSGFYERTIHLTTDASKEPEVVTLRMTVLPAATLASRQVAWNVQDEAAAQVLPISIRMHVPGGLRLHTSALKLFEIENIKKESDTRWVLRVKPKDSKFPAREIMEIDLSLDGVVVEKLLVALRVQ